MNILEASIARLKQEISAATQALNDEPFNLDGGKSQTLAQSIAEAKLDPADVVTALSTLTESDLAQQHWRQASDQAIIHYLLTRFHQIHRIQLQVLQSLAERVEARHPERKECPLGLAQHLTNMQHELDLHMQKEEQILFPLLSRGQGAMAAGPIHVMHLEHDEHAQALKQIDLLTHDMSLPAEACRSWQVLYEGLSTFKADLQKHIDLENNILFARYTAAKEAHYAPVL